jgi:hypothetical protein
MMLTRKLLHMTAALSLSMALAGCQSAPATTADEPAGDEAKSASSASAEQEPDSAQEAALDDTDAGQANADESTEDDAGQSAQPPQEFASGTFTGKIGGDGIQEGKLKLDIEDDQSVTGSVIGMREGGRFVVPMRGTVSAETGDIELKGSRGSNELQINGRLTNAAVTGVIQGKIHGKDVSTRFSIPK